VIARLARVALVSLLMTGPVRAESASPATREEAPAAVEAELATRQGLCTFDGLGELVVPERALMRAELNGDRSDDFILALCRLACAGNLPKVSTACDQSLIFLSDGASHYSIRMPGEVLDIRRGQGAATKLLSSSSTTDQTACPVADGVCNTIYEIRDGELVEAGIE